MTTTTLTAYGRALGARLLGEANDLKRTPEALAVELGVPLARVRAAIAGALEPYEYRSLFEQMADRYPIAFGRLWIEPSDAPGGVRHMSAGESEASTRTFERRDRTGTLTPYYEYRDTAMSRLSPFRPEWIRELRVVGDSDPDNPDVAYNKGHFLHQTTFFVGPVNFYWEVNGTRHCAELETGDSNYITPFWPHSFATRDGSRQALIIAVTYGGEVARARDEAGRMGPSMLRRVAVDLRSESAAFVGGLRRHLQNESMPETVFAERCALAGLPVDRLDAILNGRAYPDRREVEVVADVLCVSPRDLLPPVPRPGEEVVVVRRCEAPTYDFPNTGTACYRFEQLARSSAQPYMKSFILTVLPGRRGDELRVPLHQYIYNFGDDPVALETTAIDGTCEVTLAPGDSAYVTPMTGCRFTGVNGRGALYVVRVPGDLHADAVFELSSMAPAGWDRVGAETTRWF